MADPGARNAAEGVYTTGPVGRHLLRMAGPASTALLFIFLADLVTLFYISLLRDERLIAAVGLSRFIEYFVIAIGLAFASTATVQVSQALGAGDKALAVRRATSCLVATLAVLCAAVGLAQAFRGAALGSFVEPGAVFRRRGPLSGDSAVLRAPRGGEPGNGRDFARRRRRAPIRGRDRLGKPGGARGKPGADFLGRVGSGRRGLGAAG